MKHSLEERRRMIDRGENRLSISEQCRLLSLHRSGLYYKPCGETNENLMLMKLIDEFFPESPFTGTRKMLRYLERIHGLKVNRKRMRRLYRLMGLHTLAPKPKTSIPRQGHTIYPYLLKGLVIDKPNQVWAADITYIPMRKGFLYLIAIIDLHSRFVSCTSGSRNPTHLMIGCTFLTEISINLLRHLAKSYSTELIIGYI